MWNWKGFPTSGRSSQRILEHYGTKIISTLINATAKLSKKIPQSNYNFGNLSTFKCWLLVLGSSATLKKTSLLLCLSSVLLSSAKLLDDPGQLARSLSARKEDLFAGLAASEEAKDLPLFLSGVDDDEPLVRVVAFPTGRWPGDLAEAELPLN